MRGKPGLVSVILPVFNGADFLREAIGSLLAQTYDHFEVIVIDDASTDGSLDVVAAFSDARIRAFSNEVNVGLSASLNIGIGHARGEFMARMDQDDVCVPERLECQVAFLREHHDIWLVGGGYAPFDEKGPRTEILHPRNPFKLALMMCVNNYFCHPSVMFRRELVSQIGVYPDSKLEDYHYFSRAVKAVPCANVGKILLAYREHSTNYSKVYRDFIDDEVRRVSRRNFEDIYGNSAVSYDALYWSIVGGFLCDSRATMVAHMKAAYRLWRTYQAPRALFGSIAAFYGLILGRYLRALCAIPLRRVGVAGRGV